MQAEFWHDRWNRNDLGWHEAEANPLLVEHFDALDTGEGSRVFVPFCGKTRDIGWLLSAGCRVAGAELSERAVEQLFAELDMEPEVSQASELTLYRGPDLEVFVGNFFDLSRKALGPVDAVYDRAALVAQPREMRLRYGPHLTDVTQNARQLLITFEYDQQVMAGPPFSISPDEVREFYGDRYDPKLLERSHMPDGLKGIPAEECVWLLTRDSGSR